MIFVGAQQNDNSIWFLNYLIYINKQTIFILVHILHPLFKDGVYFDKYHTEKVPVMTDMSPGAYKA